MSARILPEGLAPWKYRELAGAEIAAAEWRYHENVAIAKVYAQHEAERDRTAAREDLSHRTAGMGRERSR